MQVNYLVIQVQVQKKEDMVVDMVLEDIMEEEGQKINHIQNQNPNPNPNLNHHQLNMV